MSPKVSVSDLSEMCLNCICDMCIQGLADDEGRNYATISEYLSNATGKIVGALLAKILDKFELDASIRFSCLEVMLREDVDKLDTRIFPRFYYEKILQITSAKGKRLKHLNLKGVWAREYPNILVNLVSGLENLRSLIIPHMASDEVIEAIACLKHLVVLDISGETCYTVNGIKKLKNNSLRLLEIGNFGKIDICQDANSGVELVAEIIENLPNLTNLKVYSFTGSAILKLYQQNPSFKTKLTNLHDTITSLETICAMLNLCPDLYSVHLDSPKAGVIGELCNFKKLNSLKLTKVDLVEFMDYLHASGYQLQSLILNHNKTSSLALSEICLYAPNLINLECFKMKLICTNCDTCFMCLQHFEILYCKVSDSTIRYVLTNAPFLKKIVIGCDLTMTDGDIFRLCAECDFANLEELYFSRARGLTATSVELLMGHCQNLKILGQLGNWDVRQEELEYLKAVVTSTNTDLQLLASSTNTVY